MAYTTPQINDILAKADRTMYKTGAIAYQNMFSELDEALDYHRDIIYIYKKAVEWGDDYFVGTEKLDKIVERLAGMIAVWDYGMLTPIYNDVAGTEISALPPCLYLVDLCDVNITNVQDGQYLTYDEETERWINTGPGGAIRYNQSITATSGQTVFVTANPFVVGLFDLYLNGVKLNSASYSTFGSYSITLVDAAVAGDILDITIYDNNASIASILSLTTTGSTGVATLTGTVLNVPNYGLESISSAAVTGTTTKTLTLTKLGGGTVAASWTDNNTDAVTSVFGRTGAVVATEGDYTLTQLGDVTLTSPTNGQVLKYNGTTWVNNTDTDTGLTSVGLTMPSAFTVSNSPLTSNGTIGVTGAGTSAQYIRGDGQLANFPSNGGGGSAYNYYLNGSVNQGTFGGDVYYEMSKIPVIGGGTNFTRTNAQGNGYIASFLTDAGDPSLLNIPAGNWNLDFYFQASSGGGSPQFYGELYKVSASNVFTLVASGSTNPEGITNGTTVDQYFTSIAVPQTSLLVTDRLAIRIYVITSGRTITLHTENSNLCEVLTTFSTGLNALNGLIAQVQYFATGTSGTDFAISSATDTHTFNLPTASATNRGALSSADWTTFNNKQNTITNPITGTGTSGQVAYFTGATTQGGNNNLFWDNTNNRLGINATPGTGNSLHVNGNTFTNTLSTNGGINLNRNGDESYISFERNGTPTAQLRALNGGGLRVTAAAAGTEWARFHSTGNFGINTGATDSGQRLQVTGDTLLKGSGATSATFALTVLNSSSVQSLSINNAGQAMFGINAQSSGVKLETDGVFRAWTSVELGQFGTGRLNANTFARSIGAADFFSFTNDSTYSAVAGTYYFLRTQNNIAPTSGTAIFSQFLIQGTINQTGGANGITRGLYVNPTLTAAADWRSIEWSNNTGWGLYGAGTAKNYIAGNLLLGSTTDSGERLQVTGDVKVVGSGNSSASNALRVLSASSSALLLSARNDGQVSLGTNGWLIVDAGARYIYKSTLSGVLSIANDANVSCRIDLHGSDHPTKPRTITVGSTFAPTSGSITFAGFEILNTINQTGGANGITRGLYVAPTLTAAADWRSIEWSNNSGWGLYGAGTASNYMNGNLLLGSTTNSGEKLQVTGTAKISDTLTIGESRTQTTAGSYFYLDSNVTFTQNTTLNANVVGFMSSTFTYAGNSNFTNARLLNITGIVSNTSSNTIRVIYGSARTSSSGVASSLIASTGEIVLSGTGAVTNAIGNEISLIQDSAKTTTNLYGVKIEDLTNSAGTITNTYGIYVGNLTAGTQTNSAFAIYQSSATNKNYFAGNVGIGTTSPTTNLDVVGGLNVSDGTSTLRFVNSGGVGLIGTLSNHSLGIRTNNTQRMHITSGGNVLIGTTTDAGYQLDVNGTAKVTGASSFGGQMNVTLDQNNPTRIIITNNSNTSSAYSQLQVSSNGGVGGYSKYSTAYTGYKIFTASDLALYNGTAGDISILNDLASGSIKFAAGGSSTAQMTLTAAGRLLLGTTTENTNILEVVGNVRITNGRLSFNGLSNENNISIQGSVYKFFNIGDFTFYRGGATGGDIAIFNDNASSKIKFGAGGSSTAQMTLTAAGRLLIGTTTESTFILDVNGTARVTGLITASAGVQYTRLNPTTTTVASTATLTPDISVGDLFTITAQAAALSVANPTGTPVNGQKMTIRIEDNGTARAITWSGTQYRASTDLALPTTTIVLKTMYLGFIYNSTDTKWDLIAFINNF